MQRVARATQDVVMKYLRWQPSVNAFIIGDIENFGYESEFIDVWADVHQEATRAVLLRYHDSVILSAWADYDEHAVARHLMDLRQMSTLMGKLEVVEPLTKQVYFAKTRRQQLAELDPRAFQPVARSEFEAQRATAMDAKGIRRLRLSIPEFDVTLGSFDDTRHALVTGTGRVYYARERDRMVSCVATSAENSLSVVVIGVGTHPGFRGRGYASACLSRVCEELLDEQKKVCLFYDNPEAGRMYRRMGFKDIGRWMVCSR